VSETLTWFISVAHANFDVVNGTGLSNALMVTEAADLSIASQYQVEVSVVDALGAAAVAVVMIEVRQRDSTTNGTHGSSEAGALVLPDGHSFLMSIHLRLVMSPQQPGVMGLSQSKDMIHAAVAMILQVQLADVSTDVSLVIQPAGSSHVDAFIVVRTVSWDAAARVNALSHNSTLASEFADDVHALLDEFETVHVESVQVQVVQNQDARKGASPGGNTLIVAAMSAALALSVAFVAGSMMGRSCCPGSRQKPRAKRCCQRSAVRTKPLERAYQEQGAAVNLEDHADAGEYTLVQMDAPAPEDIPSTNPSPRQ
jgi:hypothetical protein